MKGSRYAINYYTPSNTAAYISRICSSISIPLAVHDNDVWYEQENVELLAAN